MAVARTFEVRTRSTPIIVTAVVDVDVNARGDLILRDCDGGTCLIVNVTEWISAGPCDDPPEEP